MIRFLNCGRLSQMTMNLDYTSLNCLQFGLPKSKTDERPDDRTSAEKGLELCSTYYKVFTQHAHYPYIDSKTNCIRHFIKIELFSQMIELTDKMFILSAGKKKTHMVHFREEKPSSEFSNSQRNSTNKTEQQETLWQNFAAKFLGISLRKKNPSLILKF